MIRRPSPLSSQAGFTVVEVLIAAFFLAVTTVMATRLLVTAERLRGHGRNVAHAEIIASGEVERLRAQSSRLVIPGDTLYEETMNGSSFVVARKAIQQKGFITTRDTTENATEYALAILKKTSGDTLLRLRFLQGRER